MNATGAGAAAMTIVGIGFGLAADTFTNVTSRLLLEVNQSTVQSVVLGHQTEFRLQAAKVLVRSRPMAIYLLRNYLRICMPFSIETSINNTVSVYHRAGPEALRSEPLSTGRRWWRQQRRRALWSEASIRCRDNKSRRHSPGSRRKRRSGRRNGICRRRSFATFSWRYAYRVRMASSVRRVRERGRPSESSWRCAAKSGTERARNHSGRQRRPAGYRDQICSELQQERVRERVGGRRLRCEIGTRVPRASSTCSHVAAWLKAKNVVLLDTQKKPLDPDKPGALGPATRAAIAEVRRREDSIKGAAVQWTRALWISSTALVVDACRASRTGASSCLQY